MKKTVCLLLSLLLLCSLVFAGCAKAPATEAATPTESEEERFCVTINTEGLGMIDYAEGEQAPEIDTEMPYQSAAVNLTEPAVYTFLAQAGEGWYFEKWTKNGEDYSTEPQITMELTEAADFVAVFAFADLQDEMEYISPDGWAARYDPTMMESVEGDGFVDFVYLDAPENKATIRFIEGKQPEEVLYEVCEAWECDMEAIYRTEGFFPGTTDKWGYWRVMNPQEDGLSRTAVAGEFNGGVLLLENVIRITGDDEKDYRVSGALEMVVDSLRYDRFDAQTMYDYIPGVYAAEQDGAVYSVELNEDHTGVLHFQDDVSFVWGSVQLTGEDFVYEYTIEGDVLMINYDGVWMQFDRQ